MPRHPPCALHSLTVSLRHVSYFRLHSRPGLVPRAVGYMSSTLVSARKTLLRLLSFQSFLRRICRFSRSYQPRLPGKWCGEQERKNRCGGADRVRTGDIRLAKPALSQLSYNPKSNVDFGLLTTAIGNSYNRHLVGHTRVELVTSPLSGVRSNQLS